MMNLEKKDFILRRLLFYVNLNSDVKHIFKEVIVYVFEYLFLYASLY